MYNEKLKKFFKERKISNKKLAEIMEISEPMIGRYFKGSDNFSSDFLSRLIVKFPDINLEYIFRNDYPEGENEENMVFEPKSSFMNLDFELQKIENRIGEIRTYLKEKKDE